MTARMIVPPEARRLAEAEVELICRFMPERDLGGIMIDASTSCPVTGIDSTGVEDVVIPRGADDCVMLQAGKHFNLGDLPHSLVLAGTYIQLHDQLRERQHVVAVTNQALERVAVFAGFSVAKVLGSYDEIYYERMSEAYSRLAVSRRRPLRPSMFYMPTTDFIETFANRNLGNKPGRVLGGFDLR